MASTRPSWCRHQIVAHRIGKGRIGFQAHILDPDVSSELVFTLDAAALAIAYRDPQGRLLLEPGAFRLWVGGDCDAALPADLTLL